VHLSRFYKANLLILAFLFFSFSPPLAWAGNENGTRETQILFFYSPGCHHCLKVKNEILPELLESTGKKIQVRYLDLGQLVNYEFLLELESRFPVIGKGDSPRIFTGTAVLAGEEAIKEKLVEYIRKSGGLSQEVSRRLKQGKAQEHPSSAVIERFKRFSVLTVGAAGFLDGLNPCAFAVIIFLISFLNSMKYRRRHLLAIGSCFILAVFLTYLLLGLGIFGGLKKLSIFYSLSKVINLTLGIISLILAFFSFRDYFVYKKTGSPGSSVLKLPSGIHRFAQRIITGYFRRDTEGDVSRSVLALASVAFFAGILIAICTAACTGQVYLPTIVFVTGVESLRAKALSYLLFYNLMYIFPLIAVFVISLLGVSSAALGDFGRKKFGLTKILLGFILLVLGLALILHSV
jgi:cytochrome c biogenesis protein CcdA